MSEYQIHIASQTPSEAVIDSVLRCCAAFDNNDKTLFESAWVVDKAYFAMDDQVFDGMDAILGLFNNIGPLVTTHFLQNHRVEFKSDKVAHLTCYALAQHKKAGTGLDPKAIFLTSGSRYFIDVVKDESSGLWKITKFIMKLSWLDGDRAGVFGQ
ncbi:hypothetical protein MRB53_038654 [Persea americana]|nr:hypothetical protein MRB53_038654 [Persea americana]